MLYFRTATITHIMSNYGKMTLLLNIQSLWYYLLIKEVDQHSVEICLIWIKTCCISMSLWQQFTITYMRVVVQLWMCIMNGMPQKGNPYVLCAYPHAHCVCICIFEFKKGDNFQKFHFVFNSQITNNILLMNLKLNEINIKTSLYHQ